MDYVIVDGQVYFGAGENKKTNIWIQNEKIISIHSDIKIKTGMKSISAQGYAVFPGMICEAPFASYLRNEVRYEKRLLYLLNNGFTTFIDVIRWNPNISLQSLILEASALHRCSPLDFTFHLSIPIFYLTLSLIKEASKLDIRQITLEINHIHNFSGHDWETVFNLARKYGINLTLYPHTTYAESKIGKKVVAEITNYWYYLNTKYGRIPLMTHSAKYSSSRYNEPIVYSTSIIRDLAFLPAKNAGIYPQKGSITVGSDADLILIPLETIKKQMRVVPHLIFVKGKAQLLPINAPLDSNGIQLHTIHSAL